MLPEARCLCSQGNVISPSDVAASGRDFSQAVRDISVPEVPTFLPVWEHLDLEQPQAADEQAIEHMAPQQRVDAAAQAVPGAANVRLLTGVLACAICP